METSKEYEPVTCVHKLPNGFSSWAFHSEESGSGPNFYCDVSVCVCSQCGTIRVAGFRQGKDGNMNRFNEEINIHSATAIDAIIKYANYIHGGEVWARYKQDTATLQAKCDRYEKALKEIADAAVGHDEIANEALKGEGEKEGKNG